MPGIYRRRHPERTVLYRVLFHYFEKFLAYQKFLDLWKNADPGLPEPEDAKTRLARLTTS